MNHLQQKWQRRKCGGGSGCCPRAPPPVATCGSGCQTGYQCGTYGCTRRKALSALTTRIDGVIVGDEGGEQAYTAPLNAKVVPAVSNVTVDKLTNPNFIFHACCEARGLPDACLRYCHFNTYTANSLERMFHKEDRCPIEAAHEIHYCAAQGIDHTESNIQKFVDDNKSLHDIANITFLNFPEHDEL
ncbi:DB module [Ancylostoma duodenale]|uniref:DB module n=1 Tax=Ancylostoma duodenale TaxID=51022 RepID=A0A0C2GE47_9BILA|nr:DB module [Ancylostoma duodenale]